MRSWWLPATTQRSSHLKITYGLEIQPLRVFWLNSFYTVDSAWTIFTLNCMSVTLCWVVSPWDTKRGFSLSDNIQQLLHTCLKFVWKSLRVESCQREKTCGCKQSHPPKKPRRRITQAQRTWSVCGPFSRRAMWWGSCQPAGRWLSPGEWSRRRRRARHSSALTPSLRLRAAVK